MTRVPDSSTFWRCAKCQTPNPSAHYIVRCVGCGLPRPKDAKPEVSQEPAPKPPPPKRPRRFLGPITLAYSVLLLVVLALTKWLGDLWWLATVLLYMPRAVWLLPLVPLGGMALWRRRWWLLPAHAALAIVVLGPLMGFNLPIRRWTRPEPSGERVRIMTLNRWTEPLEARRLIDLIERERIDVICFQEGDTGRSLEHEVLADYLAGRSWHKSRDGSIVGRYPILSEMDRLQDSYPEYGFWQVKLSLVEVRGDDGRPFRVASIHMPTMRFGFERLMRGDAAAMGRYQAWRLRQVELLMEKAVGASDLPTLVAGDFNAPTDSRMMDMLRKTLLDGFTDAGLGYDYTRPANFPWVGIDHILATPEWAFTRCRVGPDVGSDHLPMIAEVVLTSPRPAEPASR